MISKKDIIAMARQVTKRSQGYQEKKVIHPKREWLIGIALFVVIVLIGGFLNFQHHVYYNTLEDNIEVTTTPIKEYKAKSAEAALMIYNGRLNKFDSLAKSALSTFPTEAPAATSSLDTDSSGELEGEATNQVPDEETNQGPDKVEEAVIDEEAAEESDGPPVLVE